MHSLFGRIRCPICAEWVRSEAVICRYCNSELTPQPRRGITLDPNGRTLISLIALLALVGTGWLTYMVWSDLQAVRATEPVDQVPIDVPTPTESPKYEQLAVGATLEWEAESADEEVVREAGPYLITVSKNVAEDLVSPVVKVEAQGTSVTLEGAATWPSMKHQISLISNRKGAFPVVMLQSFSGGAHCCNSIRLAGFSGGKLTTVDLGAFDGDYVELPSDVSGDGVADFVLGDDAFLYAFASYASSYSPPKILNVVNGTVIDVSDRPAFRKVNLDTMNQVREVCRYGESGDQRNGACPAYVASAARVGKLEEAWQHMLAAYDAKATQDLPTACRIESETGCPDGLVIRFKSYPEALLYFLKDLGYVPSSWQPPETFTPKQENNTTSSEWTA